ncbi:gp617 [Bacillus phage G]|uniref:Gp617 n=1 Tax=Bacillus phage G TaxID=2884420 RepID=G3MAZ7_9CAUD|nr:gp617 [Bacillus phage G]AEO93862.1 gp617 [Bacillus phage G]
MTNLIDANIKNEEIREKFNQFVSKLKSMGCGVLVCKTWSTQLAIRFSKNIRLDEATCSEVLIDVSHGEVKCIRVDMTEGENQINFSHDVREIRLDRMFKILERIIVWIS